MSTKPRVLLDVDGVLADFVGGVLAILGSRFDIWRKPEEITEFDLSKSLGLHPDIVTALFGEITNRQRFAADLAVYPGAVDGVRRLHEIADVYVVTSPWNSNPTWTHDREAWLARHFDIPHSHVVHTSAKHLVCGDLLVDDKTSTLVEWSNAHPGGFAVQWQTPHNRLDGWKRRTATSWSELLDFVRARRIWMGIDPVESR